MGNPALCGLSTSLAHCVCEQVTMSVSFSCAAGTVSAENCPKHMLTVMYCQRFANWKGIHRCSSLFLVSICYREKAQTWHACSFQSMRECLGQLSWDMVSVTMILSTHPLSISGLGLACCGSITSTKHSTYTEIRPKGSMLNCYLIGTFPSVVVVASVEKQQHVKK